MPLPETWDWKRAAMRLSLIEPDISLEAEFMGMLAEFEASGGPVPFVMHFGRRRFADIVEAAVANAQGTEVTPNMEPSTTWWFSDQNRHLLGVVNIRHRLNEYLENYGGHIGYGIRPSERGKGCATALLSLALRKAETLKLKRVLITCEKNNVASRKVIQKNGGVLEDERVYMGITMLRYWIDI